jgi:hypothetical protein
MKKIIQRIISGIKGVGKKIRPKTMVKYFGLSFTILALLLSIHTDVLFQQESEKIYAAISIPFSTFIQPTPPAIELSNLLPENVSEKPALPTLYVFVLDVSKSMLNEPVSKEELEQYNNDLNDKKLYSENPVPADFLPQTRSITTFDIARAELCRYLSSVQDFSNIAIWKFGTNPELVVPDPSNTNKDIYVKYERTPGGGHTKSKIIESLSKLSAIDQHTNFEKLLQQLSSTYRQQIEEQSEVHFIIISDFAHDITDSEDTVDASQNSKDKLEGSILKSRYRISALKIADYFRGISSNEGKTFHMAVVSGSKSAICEILPIAGETLAVYSYRELQLMPSRMGKEFDFLRSYHLGKQPLPFYYSPGDFKVLPLRIHVDSPKYKDSLIRLALASETPTQGAFSPKIEAFFEGKHPKWIRLDGGGITEIMEKGSYIQLKPRYALQPQEAASYRLLISWAGQNGSTNEAKKTYAVPIVFYQRLSWFSAFSILAAEAFTAFFFLGFCWGGGLWIKKWRSADSGLGRQINPTNP